MFLPLFTTPGPMTMLRSFYTKPWDKIIIQKEFYDNTDGRHFGKRL